MRCLGFAITVFWAVCLYALPGATQEKATPINIGYSSISGSQAILRVTKDAGLFQKNGLDASLVLIAGGSGIIQALIAGDLPVAIVGGEPSIMARVQGGNTLILGGLINIVDFSIITAPEVKRPQDLRGKRVAVSRFGSSTDFVIRYALQKWGLVPDRDVALLQIGSQPARLAALKSGAVHGTIVGPPADIIARKSGFTELSNAEQLNLAYPNTCIVSTASTISRNESIVRLFMKAMVEGIQFFKTQKPSTLKSLDAFARLGQPDLIEETYRHYHEILPRVPYPDLEGIRNVLKEIAAKDARARGLKPETFADTRFLKELEESGFVQKLYR